MLLWICPDGVLQCVCRQSQRFAEAVEAKTIERRAAGYSGYLDHGLLRHGVPDQPHQRRCQLRAATRAKAGSRDLERRLSASCGA